MAKSHSNSQIAKRYASAMFRLAGKDAAKMLPEVAKLSEIAALDDVSEFFHNPLLTRGAQAEIVKTLLESQGFSKLMVDAIVRVALNRRLPLVSEILVQFKSMVLLEMGEMELDIISAKPLTASDISVLSERLSKIYGKKIHANAKVDPSLIGGIMLKMQDKLIDYSVAGKLARLGQHLKSVSVH